MIFFKNTARSKDFQHACKLAKKRGLEFDAVHKVWVANSDSQAEAARMFPEYFSEWHPADALFTDNPNN
jgi:hypothetical protein